MSYLQNLSKKVKYLHNLVGFAMAVLKLTYIIKGNNSKGVIIKELY